MEDFQVKFAHLADFEAPDAEYQPRCDSSSIELKPILLPFHSASHYKDQIGRFYRVVAREELIEPVQARIPPGGDLFGVAFGHCYLFFAGKQSAPRSCPQNIPDRQPCRAITVDCGPGTGRADSPRGLQNCLSATPGEYVAVIL